MREKVLLTLGTAICQNLRQMGAPRDVPDGGTCNPARSSMLATPQDYGQIARKRRDEARMRRKVVSTVATMFAPVPLGAGREKRIR
jgi:hypothetical protein